MMKKVTIVDYGVGNLLSVKRALEHCGAGVHITDKPEYILESERVLLPGVGAFASGMQALRERGLIEPLKEFAHNGKSLLGICLGMQLMFDSSEEFGHSVGLGLVEGEVLSIPSTTEDGREHKIPHIGWNTLLLPSPDHTWNETVFQSFTDNNRSVYFVHSFMACPLNKEHLLAVTNYNGRKITAAIKKGRLFGCQFHPEKSGSTGLQIIKNFIDL